MILMWTCVLAVSHEAVASGQELVPTAEILDETVYSPYVNRDYPDQVLFGDALKRISTPQHN